MENRVILPPGANVLKDYIYLIEKGYIDFVRLDLMKEKKYKYYVIEGIDGVGKTTVSQLAVSELRKKNIDAVYVYEPYTDEIKNLLSKNPDLNPMVESMLFAADRLYLHVEILAKLLLQDKVVVGDRSFVASLVYQVIRGAPEEFVYSLNYYAIRPSMVILLDALPEVVIERLGKKTKKQLTHLEKLEYLHLIRQRYFEVLDKLGLNYCVIDANRRLEDVLNDVLDIIIKESV